MQTTSSSGPLVTLLRESGPFWSQGQTPSPDLRGGNGLVLNAAKTQLMIGGNAKKKDVLGSPSTSGASRCTHSMKLSFLGSNLTLHSQQYLTTSTSLRQQQSGLHSSLGLPCTYQEENTYGSWPRD
ncbi:Hypothetical protein FKW44_000778 [Caligus rogercresseyi]|uniref:Uncharacterized protein n=1 Tax=Caligus rogercresseyi TaxID=217165 RepID=A0A7T8QV35_CALRO|nr:Hypothetical protein FKW44_000778 [Caligus rogercresseyi]